MKTSAAILIPALVAAWLAGCARPGPANTSSGPPAPPANGAAASGAVTEESIEPTNQAVAAAADPNSAAAAGELVRRYYALIGEQRYGEARRLWGNDGEASDQTETAFAAGFGGYDSYNAEVGAPGEPEGGAGSIYVDVPVIIYGRRGGQPFRMPGTVSLRRVNDVPGSTPAQRRWHIERIALQSQA